MNEISAGGQKRKVFSGRRNHVNYAADVTLTYV